MHLIFKRIFAWIIDWLIIAVYACALFGVMMTLSSMEIVTLGAVHPVKGQVIGFLTLTLPVVLYCIFTEAGSRHATFGKRIMKIEIMGNPLTTGEIVLRNVIKFLPWEFAHAGILWINYINTPETPRWIWLLLIGPQVLVVIYVMSIVATKGSRSLYDMIAGTRVRHLVNHLPVK
jgi:uncharacterized RDD family membrane protein YckC